MSLDSPKKSKHQAPPYGEPTTYGLALGTNLGDRLTHLRNAREQLLARLPQAELTGCSSLWETDPVDCPPGSPSFLNAVIEILSVANPEDVLAICQEIEADLGREASETRGKNAARPIDLDILYAGDFEIDSPHLIVPHPRLTTRRFVLVPLAEIRPNLEIAGQKDSVSLLLEKLQSDEPQPTQHLPASTW